MTGTKEDGVGFFFEAGVLCERLVSRRRGTPYVHRCQEATFRSVVGWIDEHPEEAFTLESLAAAERLPISATGVALRFLHEYGLIERIYPRMNRSASPTITEDALTCWHALRVGITGREGVRP